MVALLVLGGLVVVWGGGTVPRPDDFVSGVRLYRTVTVVDHGMRQPVDLAAWRGSPVYLWAGDGFVWFGYVERAQWTGHGVLFHLRTRAPLPHAAVARAYEHPVPLADLVGWVAADEELVEAFRRLVSEKLWRVLFDLAEVAGPHLEPVVAAYVDAAIRRMTGPESAVASVLREAVQELRHELANQGALARMAELGDRAISPVARRILQEEVSYWGLALAVGRGLARGRSIGAIQEEVADEVVQQFRNILARRGAEIADALGAAAEALVRDPQFRRQVAAAVDHVWQRRREELMRSIEQALRDAFNDPAVRRELSRLQHNRELRRAVEQVLEQHRADVAELLERALFDQDQLRSAVSFAIRAGVPLRARRFVVLKYDQEAAGEDG